MNLHSSETMNCLTVSRRCSHSTTSCFLVAMSSSWLVISWRISGKHKGISEEQNLLHSVALECKTWICFYCFCLIWLRRFILFSWLVINLLNSNRSVNLNLFSHCFITCQVFSFKIIIIIHCLCFWSYHLQIKHWLEFGRK